MKTKQQHRKQVGGTKVTFKVGGNVATANLIDNETTRNFVSLLPLTLTMNDLFKREKFAHVPRAISEAGERTRTYEVGDVIYWSRGPAGYPFYGSEFSLRVIPEVWD